MKDLGLPVPQTLFDNLNAAVANAGLVLDALETLCTGATMAEVIKATTGLEKLKVTASLGGFFLCWGRHWDYRCSKRALSRLRQQGVRYVCVSSEKQPKYNLSNDVLEDKNVTEFID
jgi:hypothetical protein